jgi:hypothetical protein
MATAIMNIPLLFKMSSILAKKMVTRILCIKTMESSLTVTSPRHPSKMTMETLMRKSLAKSTFKMENLIPYLLLIQ